MVKISIFQDLLKKVYQNVSIEPKDIASGKVKIINKYAFTNLNQFQIIWELSEDGIIIQKGTLEDMDIKPLSNKTVTIPFKKFQTKNKSEYFIAT